MEVTLACMYFVILALALQVVTVSICARHAALWKWRNLLRLAAFVWLAMALAKKGYIDEIHPPNDGLLHETVARETADLLDSGKFSEAFSNLGPGNAAYQFALGIFYAVSHAPEVVTYGVNGGFAFWGLLALLEVLCRQTNCARLPAPVVFIFSLLPSALLWTTTNLKEGPILWSICMMCYWTVPASQYGGRPPRVLPVFGLLLVMAMRPHIAMAWLLAIAAGNLLHTKRFGLLFASTVGVVVSISLLSILRPQTFEEMVADGATAALSNRYDTLSNLDDAGRAPIFGGKPIPIVSGLALILFRPWPTEAQTADAFLAGLEVWVLVAFGLLNWTMARGKRHLLLHPGLVTQFVLLLLLGFFFSYMYNMGLAVRHRLMCFPAVLAIYTWPLLARHHTRDAPLGWRVRYRGHGGFGARAVQ
jgi:hypothetical protein